MPGTSEVDERLQYTWAIVYIFICDRDLQTNNVANYTYLYIYSYTEAYFGGLALKS